MPEIKHQFTGGKMNKDLDERLVPNGEYRDAMNIQVSTSEGSDVGTAQNILGNSLVGGQDFITPNSICVGSVADEKNDKLYWFISKQELLGYTGEFINLGENWTVTDGSTSIGAAWDFSNNQANNIGGSWGWMETPVTGIENGKTYTITYDIVVASPEGSLQLANHNPDYDNSGSGDNVDLIGERHVGTYSVTWIQGSFNVGKIKIYATHDFSGTIDNISIKEVGDVIVEYDKSRATIKPVVVDTIGNVLKFNPKKIVTGISVIDDLLFWTDNRSEPKKINIQRSIEGTDSSGVIHTFFINSKTSVNYVLKEEHITVIKKSPDKAPAIQLVSERFSDTGEIYSGIMKITSEPTPPTTSGATNEQNQSSLWIDAQSGKNRYYDFSELKVGQSFDSQIETDIDGNSGFTLNWQEDDEILFKEFGGNLYDEIPEVPLTEYSVKAKVLSAYFSPSDEQSEIARNGDFNTPNATGSQPKYWLWTSSNISYIPANNSVYVDKPATYSKIEHTGTVGTYAIGDTYVVSVKVSNHIQGKLNVKLFNSTGSSYFDDGYRNYTGTGLHTHTFTIDTSSGSNAWTNIPRPGIAMFQFDADSNSNLFEGTIESISIINATADNAHFRFEVLELNNPPTVTAPFNELRFVADKVEEEEKLFEFKFPRFAYRYQYEDREYSAMSPFSSIAFLPGNFDYHPKKGYNLGMTNKINSVIVRNFVANTPDGVIAVDILYKDDSSPSIYVVDTIKPQHNTINNNTNPWNEDAYTVSSEQISKILPSNQLLRSWDNVPRKALAQDISGNRIIYGNYVQGFNLKNGDQDYYPDFRFNIISDSNSYLYPKKSIKSLREYQLGVVFVDEYGRETPVVSNFSGNKKIEKALGDKSNKLEVGFKNSLYPRNLKYFKFFIKETSGEYYNVAMDRYYDAEDSHIWLSFPSSDRNKIDIDTFLILKKGVESNYIVKQKSRYKVLDIQNQAPDFIKQNKVLIVEETHKATSQVFTSDLSEAPLLGKKRFKLNYEAFNDSVGSKLHEIKENLYVEFTNETNNTSKRYRVSEITTDFVSTPAGATYSVGLHKALEDDVNFITDSVDGLTPTLINNGTVINIYKYVEENSSKFDGRFFVKINIDEVFNENITTTISDDTKYRTVFSKKLYYLSSDVDNLHRSNLTGQRHGLYDDTTYGGNPGFGSFAPFFRNYNEAENTQSIGTGNQLVDVGQYMFGSTSNAVRPWKMEFNWWIRDPNVSFGPSNSAWRNTPGYGQTTNPNPPDVKVADSHGWNETQRSGVFNSDGEQTDGDVWFIDGGPFAAVRWGPSDNLSWANTSGLESYVKDNVGVEEGITISNISGKPGVNINIAIGGIYHEEVADGSNLAVDDFFNIGANGGNPNYGGVIKNMVDKFYPGQKFRFREDPTQEVYTVQTDIRTNGNQKLRWKTIETLDEQTQTSNAIDGDKYGFWWNDSGTFSDTLPTGSGHSSHNFQSFAKQLSPNFSKGWTPRVLDSNNEAVIAWDPTNGGTPGPITNGLELSINHASVTLWSSGPFWIKVSDIIGTDVNTGKNHAITTGMILTSHSDGADTFTAGTSALDPLVVRKIEEPTTAGEEYTLYLSGYTRFLTNDTPTATLLGISKHNIFSNKPNAGEAMIFQQPAMNGYSQYSVNRINAQHNASNNSLDYNGISAIGYHVDFVEPIESESILPTNPAIWETEPKESADLDIYYEASGLNPIQWEPDTSHMSIPLGSTVQHLPNDYIEIGTIVEEITFNAVDPLKADIKLHDPANIGSLVSTGYIEVNDNLKITKPNGEVITVRILGWDAANVSGSGRIDTFIISTNLYDYRTKYILNWHNCYSFGNGVESNRIRDNFNLPFISNGVKVSTTLDEGLNEEHRKYGLIYSGIYNSNSSTNNLNQFIAAEKITKDLNPVYGSIQKLHTRDSDLLTLCEDKCLRILADKDAVFNADGNPQLTANTNVLGQTIPFSGEFGISTNPESFASESYRVYFADKVRGSVIRLSRDGLTPISMFGMKDWFRDNLKVSRKIIGSYDDKKDEYNITLKENDRLTFENVESIQTVDTSIVEFEVTDDGSLRNPPVPPTYVTPTGTIFAPIGTSVQSGDILSGPGIPAGTLVVSVIILTGPNGNYMEIVLNNVPWSQQTNNFNQVPSGVTNHIDYQTGAVPTSPLTGLGRYYTSTINFSRLTTSSISTVQEIIIPDKTLSFKEDVKGWVSFKSFTPELGVSLASDYYTMFNGRLFFHNDESVARNHFYGANPANSSINVILNDGPGSVKSFHTLSYEGSQSKVDQFIDAGANSDIQPYNLASKPGWFVSDITTDKQIGSLNEFIEKEGKWFNHIKGVDSDITSETDFGAFDIQGIGILSGINQTTLPSGILTNPLLTFDSNINSSLQVGDIIHFQQLTAFGPFDTIDSSGISKCGDVIALTKTTVTVNLTGTAPVEGNYIMFAKNHAVNTSSLVGYYADVKLENNSHDKVELFSIGSEVTESSK